MPLYDKVDWELDRVMPEWRTDGAKKAFIEEGKKIWNNSGRYMEEDGSAAHVQFLEDHAKKRVEELLGPNGDRVVRQITGGVYRPRGWSPLLDRRNDRGAEKRADRYLGDSSLRMETSVETSAREQHNRSHLRFMTPEEKRRQDEEVDQRRTKFTYRDPEAVDEHANLVSHSIPIGRPVRR